MLHIHQLTWCGALGGIVRTLGLLLGTYDVVAGK